MFTGAVKERLPFGNRWFINTWKEIDWLTPFLTIESVFLLKEKAWGRNGGGRCFTSRTLVLGFLLGKICLKKRRH